MAFTPAQEAALLALLDAKTLLEAPDGGTPKTDTSFAVMQSTAGTKIQQMPLYNLVFNGNAATSLPTDTIKPITRFTFNASVATEAVAGIIKATTDAEITAGSAKVAITADKQEFLFKENIKQGGDLDAADLDSVNTGLNSNVSAINIVSYNLGSARILNGTFTITPTNAAYNAELIFNNARQPSFTQSGGMSYTTVSLGTRQIVGGATIAAEGAHTGGVGQIKLTFAPSNFDGLWTAGSTSTISFSFIYQAKF